MSETELDIEAEEDEDAEITEEDARGDDPELGTLQHPEGEPVTDEVGRCEASTITAGTLFQCGLQEGHTGEHSFSPSVDHEPPADDSEKRMRQANERLNRENERHWNRIQEIMGADAAGLVPCELCFVLTPGFRWDAAPNEETTNRVRIAIGMPDLSNLAPSATETQCNDCRGLGEVRTGSTVPGKEKIKCDACAGKGYVGTRPRLNLADDPQDGGPSGDNVVAFPDDGVERDMFGTPATDPDYGKMPNMRDRPVDYWATNRS
jgi:hypothetical protein